MERLLPFLLVFAASQSPMASLPEENMNTVGIVAYNGYPIQAVTVTTSDGYILTMHRIPYGKTEMNSVSRFEKGRPVVLLQHGLLASSADWVMNLPEQSLGFLLADSGFDVWMGNVRGNVYSRGHINGSATNSRRYWQFSWDDMALIDLPAMIDRILSLTKKKSLHYVGYSQGTIMMFAFLSEKPMYARKIKQFFAMAPVSRVSHIKGALSYIGKRFLPEIEFFVREVGEEEFLPSTFLSRLTEKIFCRAFSIINPLCQNFLFHIIGPDTKQLNKTRLLVYLSHVPAGTSTQNIIHWAQMTVSGRTQKYDYQSESANRAHYGTPTPPVYDLSRFNVPTHIFYSPTDWLADPQDVKVLLKSISHCIQSSKNVSEFNHIDFVWGLRAPTEVYDDIIQNIKQVENMNAFTNSRKA